MKTKAVSALSMGFIGMASWWMFCPMGFSNLDARLPAFYFVSTHAAGSFRLAGFPYYARESPEAIGWHKYVHMRE